MVDWVMFRWLIGDSRWIMGVLSEAGKIVRWRNGDSKIPLPPIGKRSVFLDPFATWYR